MSTLHLQSWSELTPGFRSRGVTPGFRQIGLGVGLVGLLLTGVGCKVELDPLPLVTTTGTGEDSSTSEAGSGSTTSECSPTDDCSEDSDCGDGLVCVACLCVPGSNDDDQTTGGACGTRPPGAYGNCIDNPASCEAPGAQCASDAMETAGVCIFDCTDACDCPAAPAEGTATPECGNILQSGPPVCYLDCAGGRQCPAPMQCVNSTFCVHPAGSAAGDPYGDCLNGEACPGGACGQFSPDPVVGACVPDCTGQGAACPDGLDGSAVPVCVEFDVGFGCVLFCDNAMGLTCPDDMTCFSVAENASVCVWEEEVGGSSSSSSSSGSSSEDSSSTGDGEESTSSSSSTTEG